jgi:hypothetical protein
MEKDRTPFENKENNLPPNLKKDRLVLELVNRTNEDRTIDLFALPQGINPPQDIEYGDLFETQYCEVTIPISEIATPQTYTINWNDEDGSPQTSTTISVSDIDSLISQLNLITNDSWSYYISGTDYILHKEPIDTWVYWTPPTGNVITPTEQFLEGTILQTGTQSTNQIVRANNGYIYLINYGILTWWEDGNDVPIGTLNLQAFISTNRQLLVYDNVNERIYIHRTITSSQGVLVDVSVGASFISNPSTGVVMASITYDPYNDIYWGQRYVSSNIHIWDNNMNFLDSWVAPPLTMQSSVLGVSKILVFGANEIWVANGENGSALSTKEFVKIGGYDGGTQTIIKTTSTSTAITASGLNTTSVPSGSVIISGTTIGHYIYDQNFTDSWIGTIDVQTGVQSWRNAGAEGEGYFVYSIFHSPSLNAFVVRQNSSGDYRSVLYDADTYLPISGNVADGYSFTGVYWNEDLKKAFVYDNLFPGYTFTGLAYSSIAITSTNQPAGTQSTSFYTENEFTTIVANDNPNTYTFQCYDVIGGSGISVTETSGNLTYPEIVQGLRNNATPYFFEDLSIYANSIEQANQQLRKEQRGISGWSYSVNDFPTITPTQNQFVILNEPLNFLPKTINYMDYVVKAGESVQLIITYTKGNLNAIAEILDGYIREGVPFDVSLKQISQRVEEIEKQYLKETLEKIWTQKQKEYRQRSIEIDLEGIFESKEEKELKKKIELGRISQEVNNIMVQEKLKDLKVNGLSTNNIKRLVANFVAKGKADQIHDEYNYGDGTQED